MLTEEYVIRFKISLNLYKLKKLRRPYLCQLFTYINTCWTKPNDAGHFDWPITIRKRANYVAGSRCHLFLYYAMRHYLCSPLHSSSASAVQWPEKGWRGWVIFPTVLQWCQLFCYSISLAAMIPERSEAGWLDWSRASQWLAQIPACIFRHVTGLINWPRSWPVYSDM